MRAPPHPAAERAADVPIKKKKSRINCISHILSKIDYEDIEHEQVELPERAPSDSYERPERSNFNYVPEIL